MKAHRKDPPDPWADPEANPPPPWGLYNLHNRTNRSAGVQNWGINLLYPRNDYHNQFEVLLRYLILRLN